MKNANDWQPASGSVGTKMLCTVSSLRMGLVAFPAIKLLGFVRGLIEVDIPKICSKWRRRSKYSFNEEYTPTPPRWAVTSEGRLACFGQPLSNAPTLARVLLD